MKHYLTGACIAAALGLSAPAWAEPVLLLQLALDDQGVHIVSQEVRDIDYKPSRSEARERKQGRVKRAGQGWLAQIVRADGSIEREITIENPRLVRGEFSDRAKPGDANEYVESTRDTGYFDLQIPVSTSDVTVRIIERKPAPQAGARSATADVDSTDDASTASTASGVRDAVQGEIKVQGGRAQ
ncbi:hypothetical protein [Chitinolyticbacter meiyuanensis]|uniref:hypothetical protein n=1 Tax=Chitinolyticbacter meiyuanensis TaxID=682798 RepID=UPI0011E5D0A4|nr:hypothetical protein [Chitinolyticbacter meiyuanensis]